MQKKEVVDYYLSCFGEKKVSRSEYREINPIYSSSGIEKLWGNWSNFIQDVHSSEVLSRETVVKRFGKNDDRIVITHVADGSTINTEMFNTLMVYCKKNNAKLGILWGKPFRKRDSFSKETFNLLKPYLATAFEFEKDEKCQAKSASIPCTQKNPLMNLDKLCTNFNTTLVGCPKQYLKILPYKQFDSYRLACSTGTLSNADYKDTISGEIDFKYHTNGAILLEYNQLQSRYVVRNLIYEDDVLCDLNFEYTSEGYKEVKSVPAMVLGDLHLPDEDPEFISKTRKQFKSLKPKDVMIHDLASWNSISHHESTKYLTKCMNRTEDTMTLNAEVNAVVNHLYSFTKGFDHINFNVVNSNHDCFIEKWLNDGEFVKDTANAKIGAQLFLEYLDNGNIFSRILPNNFKLLTKNTSFNILGYELSEHGDCGISGARGSVNSFNKGFEKIIIGHTHSPEIREKTFVVGTLSKLIQNYNQKGMTTWAASNAVIHSNGTVQLLFL